MSRELIDSGIEWVGFIPETWNIVRFKDVYINKKEIAGQQAEYFQRLSLTLNGVLKRSKEDNDGLQPKDFYTYQILRKNDLVFKMIDLQNINTSRVGLSPYDGLVSPAYLRFAPRGEQTSFLYFYFMSLYYNTVFNHIAGDGVRSALNAKDMSTIKCPFPSLEEQNLIVNVLNDKIIKIDELIKIQERQIINLEEYRKSIITECLTKGINNIEYKNINSLHYKKIPTNWKIARFKDLGICRNGLTYSPSNIVTKKEGILVLRSSNIQNNELNLNDNVYVNCNIREELMVQTNDILICSRNGSAKLIGKNVLIPEGLKASFGAFMMIYKCKDYKYIRYILSSNIFLRYLGTFLTVSVNQLTITNFLNIKFPYPLDDNERKEIVNYLDLKCLKINDLIKIKKDKILKLQEYKKSLIYEYVTGKKSVYEE